MVEPEILAYYERNAERDRLASGARRIEFLRVRDLLACHLPPPPAKILDVGGGAGIYALPLAAADSSADAVLLLGPLYHLNQPE